MSLSGAGSTPSSKIIFLSSVSVKKMNEIFGISVKKWLGLAINTEEINFFDPTTRNHSKISPPQRRIKILPCKTLPCKTSHP
jgi:hypothetical protein